MKCSNRGITLLNVPDKVLTLILPRHIEAHLLRLPRLEESAFPPANPVHHIPAFPAIVERRSEFRLGLLAAHINSEVFDSIRHKSHCEIPRLSCDFRSEAGLYPCVFQHFHGMNIG